MFESFFFRSREQDGRRGEFEKDAREVDTQTIGPNLWEEVAVGKVAFPAGKVTFEGTEAAATFDTRVSAFPIGSANHCTVDFWTLRVQRVGGLQGRLEKRQIEQRQFAHIHRDVDARQMPIHGHVEERSFVEVRLEVPARRGDAWRESIRPQPIHIQLYLGRRAFHLAEFKSCKLLGDVPVPTPVQNRFKAGNIDLSHPQSWALVWASWWGLERAGND